MCFLFSTGFVNRRKNRCNGTNLDTLKFSSLNLLVSKLGDSVENALKAKIDRVNTAFTQGADQNAEQLRKDLGVNGSDKTNPNFSVGTGASDEANQLGKVWVGDGAVKMSDGSGMVSADGTRAYRFPTEKSSPYSTTGIQANFETYSVNSVTGQRVRVEMVTLI